MIIWDKFSLSAVCRLACSTLLLLLITIIAGPSIMAQAGSTTGTITGRVLDEQGAALIGATIEVRSIETNFTRSEQVKEDGSYIFVQLPPGDYQVSVSSSNFAPKSQPCTITIGSTLLLNFTLSVGNASDVVEVTASSAVDTTRTESSTNIDRDRINSLPINRRNFLDFSLTSARVIMDRVPIQGAAATSGLSFNGQPARENNITIDGLDNNDLGPGAVRSTFSQEAVQEFQVVSDNYSAEFGHALGGIVNIVTRGGTNELHGATFGFLRNDSTSARDPFSPTEPPYRQYQFGATLGGPIKRDRAFFFSSFERLTIKQNNIVTISNETVAAARRLNFAINNGPIPFSLDTTSVLLRGDARLGANDTFWARYNYGGSYNGALEPFGGLRAETGGGIQRLTDKAIAFSNTHISPGLLLVNETRFLYSHRDQNVVPIRDEPLTNLTLAEGTVSLGRAQFLPQPRQLSVYHIVDNISLTRGRHQLKFGGDLIYTNASLRLPVNDGGLVQFDPIDFAALTGIAGAPTLTALENFDPSVRTAAQREFLQALAIALPARFPTFPTNLPLASLSLPVFYVQGFLPKAPTLTNEKIFSLFLQDEFKVRPNLLIKTGLRYDLSRVKLLPGNNGNFSPRIALAFQPARLPHLNLHAAYGIFFAAQLFGIAAGIDPQRKIIVLPFPFSILPFALPGHHFPEAEQPPAGVDFISQLGRQLEVNPKLRSSYSHQANLGIDYFFGTNTAISLNYNFVRGIKILGIHEINPIVRPVPGDPVMSAITGRIDPTRGSILQSTSSFDSYYHGVTISLNRRFVNHFGVLAHYTFSKSIDNFLDIITSTQDLNFGDPLRPGDERGLSFQDVRQRFVVSGTWELDYRRLKLLNNLQISTILSLESGKPYNLLAGVDLDQNGDTPPGDRPAGIGRNVGITPGFASLDLRLTRLVNIKERIRAQFIFEVFNLFNRVNISDFDRTFPPDAQGNFQLPAQENGRYIVTPDRYRNAFAPRQLQLGVKIAF